MCLHSLLNLVCLSQRAHFGTMEASCAKNHSPSNCVAFPLHHSCSSHQWALSPGIYILLATKKYGSEFVTKRNSLPFLALTYTYMYMCCTEHGTNLLCCCSVSVFPVCVLYIALGRVMRMVNHQYCVLHRWVPLTLHHSMYIAVKHAMQCRTWIVVVVSLVILSDLSQGTVVPCI